MVKKKCRIMGDLEGERAYNDFWKSEFPRIIAEFENTENGRLVQKNKKGACKGRKHFDILNVNDDHVKDDIEVLIS